MKKVLLLVSVLICSSFASAHSRLKATGPISIRSNDPGVKSGPCGSYARIMAPSKHIVGSTITIEWEEVIHHPGRFEFYFSQGNDLNFVLLKTVQNDQNGTTDLPHAYSTSLSLPTQTCTNCTIQLIQVMTENPASPSLYFSCADIQLVPTGTVVTNPPPSSTPAPSSTNSSQSCH